MSLWAFNDFASEFRLQFSEDSDQLCFTVSIIPIFVNKKGYFGFINYFIYRLKSEEPRKKGGDDDEKEEEEEACAADEIDYEKLMEYFGEVQSRKRLEKSSYEVPKRKIMQSSKKSFNDDGFIHDF